MEEREEKTKEAKVPRNYDEEEKGFDATDQDDSERRSEVNDRESSYAEDPEDVDREEKLVSEDMDISTSP